MRTRGRLGALAGGTLVGLMLAEIAVRLAVDPLPRLLPQTIKAGEPYPTRLYAAHPFLPFQLRPGLHVWLNPTDEPANGSRAQWIDYRINSLGGRGPEPAEPRPSGLVRIAALGGSTTFSVCTREDQSWPHVLQSRLNASAPAGLRYEVLNFGTPKASSPYSLVMLATRVIHLEPDVVIAYDGINDISAWRFPGLRPDHAHLYADLREPPAWLEAVPAWAFRSALVAFAWERLAARSQGSLGEREDLAAPGPFDVPKGIAILLANYRSMRGICAAHGARFVSATFHVRDEGDDWGRAVSALNEELRHFGRAEGVPIADLAARIPHGDRRLHVDGAHFSAAGDAQVAELFEEALRAEVLPELLARRATQAGVR